METGRKPSIKSARGRPKVSEADDRIEAILDAATKVIMERGYAKANTREIARTAGASKETFYQRFPTKASLFAALIERKADSLLSSMAHDLAEEQRGPREVLIQFSERLLAVMMNPEAERLLQIVISEAKEFPDLASAFWEKGPGLGRELLKTYLKRLAGEGRIHKEDVEFASEQFLGALIGSITLRTNLAMAGFLPNTSSIKRWVEKTVDWFLLAHLIDKAEDKEKTSRGRLASTRR